MKISIFDGDEQVHYAELAGDVSDYDIIINSSSPVEFPSKQVEGEPPELPTVDVDSIDTDTRREIYQRIRDSPDSVPAEIREFIYQRQVLTRKQLDSWLESQDRSSRSGGVRGTLIVLDEITDEINRLAQNEGDEMQIIWTGET